MRTIKFRAKLHKKEYPNSFKYGWVYGFVSKNKEDEWHMDTLGNDGSLVGDGQYLRVDHKTIGQYTGLKDKHGKDIYEGDICFIQIYGNFGEPSVEESFNVQVKWEGNAFHLVDADGDTWTEWATYYKGEDVEIIGNIHENPELLEGENHEDNKI